MTEWGGNPKAYSMREPCVYVLTNKPKGVLYIGVTSDLAQRIWQHKHDLLEGFTKRHRIHRLVWYETHDTMETAINKEKALKKWNRAWKVELIEKDNPGWKDLYDEVC